jgi:hypothetical protein
VFDSLYIHHMTNVGIGMWPDSATHITLRNSEIAHNTGSGLYWGYPNRNTIHDVLIERNYIHHCPIAGQSTHYGIQWKGWCYRAVIQDNVLHDVGGSTRCGIVVYYGRKPFKGDVPADINIVRGNVLWNCRNEGITVMSDALIENNIVFDAVTGINIQQYSDESFTGSNYVENLAIRNNTIYRCSNTCISVGGWANAGPDVSLTGNVVYQDQAGKNAVTGGSVWLALLADNYYYGQSDYFTGFNAGNGLTDFTSVTESAQVPNLDFYPSASAPFIKAFTNPGIAVDFNGTDRSRSLTEAGAYTYTTPANPGWAIQEGFKQTGSVCIRNIQVLPPLYSQLLKEMVLYNIKGGLVRNSHFPGSGIYIGRIHRACKILITH